jgi:hypothetical protein
MLDEPPLIVKMRGLVGFMDDAGGVRFYPNYLGIDGIETDLGLEYVLLAMSPNLHFTKAQRRHFGGILVVASHGMSLITGAPQACARATVPSMSMSRISGFEGFSNNTAPARATASNHASTLVASRISTGTRWIVERMP